MPRFQWLWGKVQARAKNCLTMVWNELYPSQAYTTRFYMGKFSGPTVKAHQVWSNDLGLLDRLAERAGTMNKKERASKTKKLVKSYVDKSGRVRVAGIKDELRSSQPLGKMWWGHGFAELLDTGFRGAPRAYTSGFAAWLCAALKERHDVTWLRSCVNGVVCVVG